ncbi:MAG: glycosyltransferase [Flavobacteriales bacterium]|nr:glycosyltransferase [Flavobacteriales bacterium]
MNPNRRKMLFITTQLPFPVQSGGVIKTWRLLEHFQEEFDLTCFCILKPMDRANLDHFKESLSDTNVVAIACEKPRSIKNLLSSYLRGKTLNQFRNFLPEVEQEISQLAQDSELLFVDHFEMFQYVPDAYTGKVIFHEHNAEYVLWERFAEVEINPIKKQVLKLECDRIRKAELDACQKAHLVFAAPNDLVNLNLAVPDANFKETYHLGEDDLLDLPELKFNSTSKGLYFLGTLSWEANVNGVVHFLDNIFPLVLDKEPRCVFYIIGKEPDIRIVRAANRFGDNVEILGYVDDLDPIIKKCAAMVLPLRFGSGMKVKFLNALYRGVPVVSSTLGAESIEVKHKETALIHDNERDFADSCVTLMNNEETWSKLSVNSRILAKANYKWEPLLRAMTEEINRL